LREERVEYGMLYFELKSSDVETNWSAILQIAGAGLMMRDAIAYLDNPEVEIQPQEEGVPLRPKSIQLVMAASRGAD